mmetsp:Transcript_29235/g.68736  ORF Transcript_29235/g.68736 Transcript_29235/m.68736 type:complete len:520 (-) Transcript_29235:41-1600(-)
MLHETFRISSSFPTDRIGSIRKPNQSNPLKSSTAHPAATESVPPAPTPSSRQYVRKRKHLLLDIHVHVLDLLGRKVKAEIVEIEIECHVVVLCNGQIEFVDRRIVVLVLFRLGVLFRGDSLLFGLGRKRHCWWCGGSGGGSGRHLLLLLLFLLFLLLLFAVLLPLSLVLLEFFPFLLFDFLFDFFHLFGGQPYLRVQAGDLVRGVKGDAVLHPRLVVHDHFLLDLLQNLVLVGQAGNLELSALSPLLGNLAHELVQLLLDVRDLVARKLGARLVVPKDKPPLDDALERRGDPRVVVARVSLGISLRLGVGVGLVEGHRVLVDNEHLGNVAALVIHGVVVRLVDLDRAGQVDEARWVGGPVAVEIPERRAVLGRFAGHSLQIDEDLLVVVIVVVVVVAAASTATVSSVAVASVGLVECGFGIGIVVGGFLCLFHLVSQSRFQAGYENPQHQGPVANPQTVTHCYYEVLVFVPLWFLRRIVFHRENGQWSVLDFCCRWLLPPSASVSPFSFVRFVQCAMAL